MDKELLEWYIQGFKDELLEEDRNVPKEFDRAYRLGQSHAIIGDDCRSVDYLSNEEILKLIKNENNR